jgi:cysteine desulfurase
VPAIVGLGAAARLAVERLPEMGTRVASLRDRLEEQIKSRMPGVRTNGSAEHRIPNVTNLAFEGIEGEAAVIALDLSGVAVSTGSACSSGSLEPSHVLMGMGLRPEVVQGSLRFSLSYHNTVEEIDGAVEVLSEVVSRLRGLARRGRA